MPHVDDFDAVGDGTIYDDISCAGHDETAVVRAELGTGNTDIRIVC